MHPNTPALCSIEGLTRNFCYYTPISSISMWYNILPSAAIVAGILAVPAVAMAGIHKLYYGNVRWVKGVGTEFLVTFTLAIYLEYCCYFSKVTLGLSHFADSLLSLHEDISYNIHTYLHGWPVSSSVCYVFHKENYKRNGLHIYSNIIQKVFFSKCTFHFVIYHLNAPKLQVWLYKVSTSRLGSEMHDFPDRKHPNQSCL